MKPRYVEPSPRISSTITNREHIFLWGRTRLSRERFSRRKGGESWRYRRWAGYITATNDGPPEKCDHPLSSFGSMTLNLVPRCAHVRTCGLVARGPQQMSKTAHECLPKKRFVLGQTTFSLGAVAKWCLSSAHASTHTAAHRASEVLRALLT